MGEFSSFIACSVFRLARVFRGQKCLTLFLSELRGQIDRRDHAVGARDAFARNIERGAMIGTGARKGQAEGNVYTGMEGVQLQRDQTLIVIHAKGGVPFLVSEMKEERVRGDGTFEDRGMLIADCRL